MKTIAKYKKFLRVRCVIQILSLFLWLFVTSFQLAAKRAIPATLIHVLVFNYSGASWATVMDAERETNRIFSQAGIGIAWLHCPIPLRPDSDEACGADIGVAGEVRLRLVDHPTENVHGVFGFTVPPAFATVYYGSIVQIRSVDNGTYETPMIMGCIMAHEIAHLVLGPGAHAPTGIMQAKWGHAELNQAIKGLLGFTVAEADMLRSNAQIRHRLFTSNEQRRKQVAQLR